MSRGRKKANHIPCGNLTGEQAEPATTDPQPTQTETGAQPNAVPHGSLIASGTDNAPAAEGILQPGDSYLKVHAASVLGSFAEDVISWDRIPWLFLGRDQHEFCLKQMANAYLVIMPDVAGSRSSDVAFLLKSFIDDYMVKARLTQRLESEARQKRKEKRNDLASAPREYPADPSPPTDGVRVIVRSMPSNYSWHHGITRICYDQKQTVLLKASLDNAFPPGSRLSCWYVFAKAVRNVKSDMLDGFLEPALST